MKETNKIISVVLSLCIMSTAFISTGCNNNGNGNSGSVPPLVNWNPNNNSSNSDSGTEPDSSTGPDSSEKPEPGDIVNPENKTPKKIEVATKPTKSEYVVGDVVDVTGGVIKVTYTDGTTELVPMTAKELTVTLPTLSSSGTKKVTVKFGQKSALFYVSVADKSFIITFDQNYAGSTSIELAVRSGDLATEQTPVRAGYTLYGWYESLDYIEKFDFESKITKDITLYALWKEDGVNYVDVTFDYGYYGQKINSYSYPIKSGNSVNKPMVDPVRYGYSFAGWVNDNGEAFDFNTAISANTTVKASWTKTVTGKNDYVFEAEDTDLTGKIGPALSGQAVEEGMIITPSAERNPSGGRAVSYLYQSGLYLDFDFACDEDVTDVTLSISLSQEYVDYTYNPDNFIILLNNTPISYSEISLTDVPYADDNHADCLNFQYFLIGSNLSLQKGANNIRVYIADSVPIEGTTMKAHAPIVDAIKLNTSAVLIGDGGKDLPKNYK